MTQRTMKSCYAMRQELMTRWENISLAAAKRDLKRQLPESQCL